MGNGTGYRLRLTNRRLRIRVNRMARMWGAHVHRLAPKAYPSRGRYARLVGETEIGVPPTARQRILGEGARISDTAITHAVLSYEGSVRLLTFKGGQPLPWPSMVLARTTFEATLRVLWLLDPTISEDLLLARIAATLFEELDEDRKLHIDLPEELARTPLEENQSRVHLLTDALTTCGFTVNGSRRGFVATPTGERVAFPLVVADASDKWWSQVGVHTYRWLSGFTHAGTAPARQLNIPVAAVESANAYVVLGLLTDAIWKSMDSYSMWVGMPNGMVRRKLAKIYGFLRSRAPEGAIQERPPSEIETMFLGMAATLDDLGFVHPKIVRRFRKHYVRRIDM